MQKHSAVSLSWQLPYLGQVASEPLPGWLVDLMVQGRLTVNRLGGFTDEVTGVYCFAGDTVTLGDGGTVFFSEAQAFAA